LTLLDLEPKTTDILADLIEFETVSDRSNLGIILYIEDYLSGLGISSHRVLDPCGSKASLLATIGPSDRAGIVLSGHTDVVSADGEH
jgi:acetylornithine deacetylase